MCASSRSPLFTATSRSCSFPMTAERHATQSTAKTCAFCPAGDPSGARFPIFHRELLNPGRESAPSSGELSGMESCGRSAELSQSLAGAPLHSSPPAGCGSPVFGFAATVGLGSGSGVSRAHGEILSAWRRSNSPAFERKKTKLQNVKNKIKKKMNCMTTIKLFRLHFPGEA